MMSRLGPNAVRIAVAAGLVGVLAVVGCGAGSPVYNAPTPPSAPPPPAGWDDALRLTEPADRNSDPNVVEVDLEARVGTIEFTPGVPTDMWTYGGGTPGPLIRVPQGARLIVHFKNNLPDETTVHWHGVRLPAAMDGVPDHSQPAVPPGGTFDYDFIVPDAGLFWYHPHVRSAVQVGEGLYGALLVESKTGIDRSSAGMAPELGPEAVLVLSDVFVVEDGHLGDPTSGGDLGTLFGREGNLMLVNGRVAPTLLARPGQRQRWRIVNTAISRYFQIAMPGHTFTRIGSDGGLLVAAQESERIVLTPGQRADVLVTPRGDAGAVFPVKWIPYDRGFGSTEFRPEETIMSVRLTADEPIVEAPPALPATLRTIEPLSIVGASAREIRLTEDTVDNRLVLGINGVPSWDAEPLHAQVGTTEVWNIDNTMDWDHPFHLHGFFFQVLDPVTGWPLSPPEWRDTVNVPRKEMTSLAVKFDDRPGMWMFHCHILDHADAGMMGMIHLAR
jgi:FtsP/CotA-like multicopper oxidase with cupredoxin domain